MGLAPNEVTVRDILMFAVGVEGTCLAVLAVERVLVIVEDIPTNVLLIFYAGFVF